MEPPLQQADIMRGPVPDYSEDSAVTDLPVKESIYPGDDHYDPSDAGFVDGVTLNQPGNVWRATNFALSTKG